MLTLSALKSEISNHIGYKDIDQKTWEAKIANLDIVKRSQKDFDRWKQLYPKKIEAIRAELRETGFEVKVVPQFSDGRMKTTQELVDDMNEQLEHINYLVAKEARLLDKLAVVLKEEELRKLKLVTRTDIHDAADYYIDYVNGDDSNDGLSTGNAWKTIHKFTTTTARSAGDRAFLRANTTWDYGASGANVDIIFDEDGTANLLIEIIGCDSVTNDPWGDASDVKPVIDFNGAAWSAQMSEDSFWKFTNFQIIDSADPENISIARSFVFFESMDFSGNSSASESANVSSNYGAYSVFRNCSFSGAANAGVKLGTAQITEFYNCTFDNNGTYGVTMWGSGGYCYCQDCLFGQSIANTQSDIHQRGWPYPRYTVYYLRNCIYNSVYTGTEQIPLGYIYSEDDLQVYGTHSFYSSNSKITKETSSPRSGGSSSYARINLASSFIGTYNPVRFGLLESGFAPKWLTKDVEYTITVYARVASAWDSALNASQAYMKVSYLSNASTAARTEIQSTETIANDTTWTAFTVTFTPLQTGFVYIWFYVSKYEDTSEYIDVDDEPVVS